jgi:radical SAM superfamily enzyme YgiQ (UPF0313 family)
MKILFIEPRPPSAHVFSRARIPRLGSVILGTIIRDLGHESRVLIEEISGDVVQEDLRWADLVAISSITSTAPRSYQIGDRARDLGKTVIHGGPHVTFMAAEGLEHGHYVVRGEGEETFPELVEALIRGRNPGTIPGLSFIREGNRIDTPARPMSMDLDSFPIPDFSLVRHWSAKGNIVPISTSRGCPHQCKFCAVGPVFGRRMRFHSIDRTMAEIRRNARGARHVFFCDDNFAADPQRARALLGRMKEEGFKLPWSTQVRVEASRDKDLLRLMKETNCFGLYIGFESINPKTLKALRKNQSLEEIKRSIRAFHRHGLKLHGMFIVGADQDVPGSVLETMRFARRMRIDTVQFMMLTPAPGTETFRELEESDRILTRDWEFYDGSHAIFHPRLMNAHDLQAETARAYRRFYSWTSALERLLRLDFFYSYLRIYARIIIIRSRRRTRRYRKKLQEDILAGAMNRLGAVSGRLPRPRAVLLADTVEGDFRLFLESYLTNLGVKVLPVNIRECLEETQRNIRCDLEERLSSLRHKAEVLLVPVLEEVGSLGRSSQAGMRSLLQQLEKSRPSGLRQLNLDIDLQRSSLYQAAEDLGLTLSQNLRRIRRAYRLALETSGL